MIVVQFKANGLCLTLKAKYNRHIASILKKMQKKKKGGEGGGEKGIKLYRVMLLINSRPQPDCSVNAVFFSTERQPG